MSHIKHNKPVSTQNLIVPFPKISIPSPQKGLEHLWRGGKAKKFQEMVLSLKEISREGVGGGVLRKKSFHVGRDIDTFWDTTLRVSTFSGT